MRFYDLSRNPVVCPSCGAEFKPATLLRTRHNRLLTKESEEHAGLRAPAASDPPVEEIEGAERAPNDDEAGEGDEEHEKEEQKEDVIEDASELGEDADDMKRNSELVASNPEG